MHSNLANVAQHPDSKISLITIDFDVKHVSKGQTFIEIKPMAQEVIEGIIRKKYPDLPEADVGRIADFAEGFPQMAVLMCEADLRKDGSLSKLTPPDLVSKLLFPRGAVDTSALEVISVCSLFDRFAFDDGLAGETALIAERLCSNMPVQKFTQAAMQFKARNILEPHMGAFTKVTPKPLAWHLASTWWESCSMTLAELLIDQTWPLSLAEAMCRQLTFLSDTPAAHTVAEKLCAPSCPFASAESLNSSRGSRLFCDLVEVNPEATLECLERVFLDHSKEQLLEVKKGRRYLVWALEKLCWEESYFERAAFVLSKFASAENEGRISNNATGQLKKLFHILLPGTKASLQHRLDLVDELIVEYGTTDIVVSCLCEALSYGHFSRSGGMVEVQAGRLPERDYVPTWAEVSSYWLDILNRLIPMIAVNDHRNEILGHLSRLFLYLVRFKFLEHLAYIIAEKKKYDPTFWVGGLEALLFALKHEGDKLSDDEYKVVQDLLSQLQPESFEDKYRLIVALPSYSNLEKGDDGQVVLLNTDRAETFGEEAGRLWPNWEASLSVVLTGEQREPSAFAIGLVRTIKKPKVFISKCLNLLRMQIESCNPAVLGEFVAALKAQSPAIAEEFLQKVEQEAYLHRYATWFICRAGVDANALQRLIRMLIARSIRTFDLRVLKFGGVLQSISPKVLEEFLHQVVRHSADKLEGLILTLELLHMYIFQNEKHQKAMAKFSRSLLMTEGLLLSLSEMQLHDWSEAVGRLLTPRSAQSFVTSIASEIVRVCELDHTRIYDFDRNLQPIISVLLKDHFDVSWPVLGKALESDNKNAPFNMALLLTNIGEGLMSTQPQPIQAAPEEKLAAWLQSHEEAMTRLLRHLRLWSLDDPKTIGLTPLGQSLFAKYGDNKAFLGTVEANLASVGGAGSLRPEYEAREILMRQLTNHKRLSVKRWAARQRRYYQKRIANALKREEEQKHGIFDGWMRDDV